MLESYSLLFLLKYFIPKLFIATICGFLIGIEREFKNKSAGLKTNITICVGSTLFTAISLLLYQIDPNGQADLNRTIAQVVSGIGFLGAGAVIKTGSSVQGLTTASIIWFIGALGVLIGSGAYSISVIVAFGFLLMTLVFDKFESYLYKKKGSSK